MRECIAHLPHGAVIRGRSRRPFADVLGAVLVVSVKYLSVVMRADNRGEGGIFALLALSVRRPRRSRPAASVLSLVVILVGAALLYGDGIITPAISVLGAAEGFKSLDAASCPRRGDRLRDSRPAVLVPAQGHQGDRRRLRPGHVGVVLPSSALLGPGTSSAEPAVLAALNPLYGLHLLGAASRHDRIPLLGVVVLAITGAEALYADMGHFGRRPSPAPGLVLAFPGLTLNYFGAGRLCCSPIPADADNPFFAPRARRTGRACC